MSTLILVIAGFLARYLTAIVGLGLIASGLYALLSAQKKISVLVVIPGCFLLFTYTSTFQQLKTHFLAPHYHTSFTIYLPKYIVPGYPFQGSNVDEFPVVAPGNKYFTANYGVKSSNNDYLKVTEFNATTPTFKNNVSPKTYACGPVFPANYTAPPTPTECKLLGKTTNGYAVYRSDCYTFTINNTRITISGDTEGGSTNDKYDLSLNTLDTTQLFKFINSFQPLKAD